MDDEEKWIAEFVRNLRITREWLRKHHGDRMIDGRTHDDFAQEAAIAIWRNNADPRFMQRKASLQQKTFFTRRFYRKPKSVQVSNIDRMDRDGEAASHVFVSRPSDKPFEPTEEDWLRLKREFNLRQVDIDMLQMRCRGIPVREIARIVGITPNSVHVRISDLKMRIMAVYKAKGRDE
jgi:DNA-directed RNA polymerase specialized sigma24 family protein